MQVDQILIRMGVDAKAVVAGLNKTTSYVKGWAASMKHEMTHGVGKLLTAGFVFDKALEGLNKIKDEILFIRRISEETGAGSNFIQSLMMNAEKSGESAEAMGRPLRTFNLLLGKAKNGSIEASMALKEMGVITKRSELGTLTYTQAMHNLAVQYQKTEGAAQKAALLRRAFGKGSFRLTSSFSGGAAGTDKMNESNFFTKISEGGISDFANAWSAVKMTTRTVMATVANIVDLPLKGYRNMAQFIGAIAGGAKNMTQINAAMQAADNAEKEKMFQKSLANQADEEGISAQEEKAKIINQQNELLERQKELSSEILDRNKASISEMAAHARKMLGIPEPKNYTVSVRDREALRIDTMEKQAKIAYERGDDAKGSRLTSEALQARSNFKGGTLKDRDPMGKTEVELEKVNLQLGPVMKMAQMVNEEHKAPK